MWDDITLIAEILAVVIVAEILFAAIKYTRRVGIKYTWKAMRLFIKSPVKTYKLMHLKSQTRKEFKVNRQIWNKGKELDKIDDLLRYKADNRVMESAEVKLSLNVYNKNILKEQAKENKKASKDKKFDKITR